MQEKALSYNMDAYCTQVVNGKVSIVTISCILQLAYETSEYQNSVPTKWLYTQLIDYVCTLYCTYRTFLENCVF